MYMTLKTMVIWSRVFSQRKAHGGTYLSDGKSPLHMLVNRPHSTARLMCQG